MLRKSQRSWNLRCVGHIALSSLYLRRWLERKESFPSILGTGDDQLEKTKESRFCEMLQLARKRPDRIITRTFAHTVSITVVFITSCMQGQTLTGLAVNSTNFQNFVDILCSNRQQLNDKSWFGLGLNSFNPNCVRHSLGILAEVSVSSPIFIFDYKRSTLSGLEKSSGEFQTVSFAVLWSDIHGAPEFVYGIEYILCCSLSVQSQSRFLFIWNYSHKLTVTRIQELCRTRF